MIGEFRNKVTIKRYGQPTQTAGGGLVAGTLTNTVNKWAKIEDRSGSVSNVNAQREWNYDYKVTVRFMPSFVERSSDVIEYGTRSMLIRSVSFESEGKQKFVILRCSLNE